MAKWIVAGMLGLAGIVALGPSGAQTAPSVQDEGDVIATGTCSYTCSSNGHTYINRNACKAACSGVCEIEAC